MFVKWKNKLKLQISKELSQYFTVFAPLQIMMNYCNSYLKVDHEKVFAEFSDFFWLSNFGFEIWQDEIVQPNISLEEVYTALT